MKSSLRTAGCRLAAPLMLLLLVTACAEVQLASHAVKRMGGIGDGDGQVGAYKIGEPYQVAGVWYYPKEDLKYRETGIASWYGPGFHGKHTANGEVFDQNDLTAAHRTLPLPSMVRVTNLENGRSIAVRVNDRGPFSNGRIIDLSRRSAQLLGFEGKGTAKVRVDILEQESRQLAVAAQKGQVGGGQPGGGDSGGDLVGGAGAEVPPAVPSVAVDAQALPPPSGAKASALAAPGAVQTASRSSVAAAAAVPVPRPDGRVTRERVRPTSIFIQAGSFLARDNATRLSIRLSRLARSKVTRARVGGQEFFRVRLGPIADVASADRLLETLIAQGHDDARVVVD